MARKEELELIIDVRQLELMMLKPDCWQYKEAQKDIAHFKKRLADLEKE